MHERDLHCSRCDGEMRFEVPPCSDGHDECPELVCTRCSTAEVAVPLTMRVWLRANSSRIAPQQRRAA